MPDEIVTLVEPLTEFTAVVDVSDAIFPGSLFMLENQIGGGLGRPDITDADRLLFGDIRRESVTPPPHNGKDPQ